MRKVPGDSPENPVQGLRDRSSDEPAHDDGLAQLRYLQEEYSNLIVSNQFDESTAHLSKTLQLNPAAFAPGAVENLQPAVTIAGAPKHHARLVPSIFTFHAPDFLCFRSPLKVPMHCDYRPDLG